MPAFVRAAGGAVLLPVAAFVVYAARLLRASAVEFLKGASTLVGDVFKMGVTRSAERPKVLLVAPPKVWDKPEWGFAGARSRSDACRACYAAEAEAHGCAFFDANDVFAIPDPAKEGGDGIHLSPANATALGAAVAAKIDAMVA